MGLNVCESRLNVPIYPIFQTFNPFTLEIKWVGVLKVWNPYQDPIYSSPPTRKVQSAKSCTFAHVQVPRSYQDLISRSYFYITSYLQGAKCKILHICTHASIKFLSRANFFITPYMQGAKYKILHIFTRARTMILSRPNLFKEVTIY